MEALEPGAGAAGGFRIAWSVFRVVALAYLAVVLLACLAQRRLMYFPASGPVTIPSHPRFAAVREVDLTASDGTALKAWHWPGERPLTLVVFHGNAGNRGDRLDWMASLRATGAGVFLLDYRGYGGSGGWPTEEGLYLDGEAAAAWLAERGLGPLVYVGESLGAGVAVEVALRRPPAALILQSPFTSAVDVAKGFYPYLPLRAMMWDRYEVLKKIERIRCPLLVIHGQEDSLVPIAMGRKLMERAPEPKEWLEIPGADHNDRIWAMDASYAERVKRFLEPWLR